jgi:hypothetical protein
MRMAISSFALGRYKCNRLRAMAGGFAEPIAVVHRLSRGDRHAVIQR